ncbi:MAG: thioredoxin family protein [Nanoarchaeota archaeon]|nr:thioredoxin family protein [Nanoarchaeota archaeon]
MKKLVIGILLILLSGVLIGVVSAECADSDSGINYYSKGSAQDGNGIINDICIADNPKQLSEAYCEEGIAKSTGYDCPNRCSEGACVCPTTTCSNGAIYGPEKCKVNDNVCVCPSCPATNIEQPAATPIYATPVQPIQTVQICTDSDNGNFYEKGVMKTGENDAGHWDLCGDSNTLTEYYCENNEAKKTASNCQNGCADGACLKGEQISEKTFCGFINSNNEEKCYTAEQNSRAYCSGIGNCAAEIKGQKGEQIIWKSSCGSYQYTTIDGNDEKIEFDCKVGEIKIEEIKSIGFKFAYWQCYDGSESRSEDTTSCKPSEIWQEYAKKFCEGKCYEDNSKCGVNSFSIWNECYAEASAGIPTITTVPVEINATAPAQSMLYYFKSNNCPYCQDMDKEIGILKQKGFFNNFGAVVYNIEDKDISEKFEIKTVPTLILYKDKCSFRKEGFMKSDEIESWAYNAECGEKGPETKEIEEAILVCKDSCPLDGKCYPFGYRKYGEYCSDQGNFIEQLAGDEACDNNFECSSNVCVSGKCISEGLIQKILSWFKSIFG